MKKIIILIFISILFSCDKKMSCENFKTGNFTLKTSEPFELEFKITRYKDKQVEKLVKFPDHFKDNPEIPLIYYTKIEWISECEYLVKYDNNYPLNDFQKIANQSGGIHVEIESIEDNCYYFISTTHINGQEQIIRDKICKE